MNKSHLHSVFPYLLFYPSPTIETVQNVYPLINTEALRYSAEILLNLDDEIPLVLLDEKEFVQLTLHLCKNAIDAMEGKKWILLIQTHKIESGVEIMIADNGCGISGQDLDRILIRFIQREMRE